MDIMKILSDGFMLTSVPHRGLDMACKHNMQTYHNYTSSPK